MIVWSIYPHLLSAARGVHQIIFIRTHTTTALKWPLDKSHGKGNRSVRLSDQLLNVQSYWKPIYAARNDRNSAMNAPSKYVLSMFPYPSGSLHMGHMRVYTISDVTARYFRLNGFNVIHPIGWDAFGLPAENAARERGVDPQKWTMSNIKSMKNQLMQTGIIFDWDRELSTCDPLFYRWTQWIFLRLYDRGLVKRKLAEVNWDPVDNTVLAAEQIDSEGKSWRSGAIAEKRKLRQWIVETPIYAKRLSDGLRQLPGWQEVAEIQSSWIGKCDVYRFLFPTRDDNHQNMDEILDLRVTDPLSVAHAPFIVIRSGHPLCRRSRQCVESPYRLDVSVFNGVSGVWMPVVVVPEDYDGAPMNLDARCGDAVTDSILMDQFKIAQDRRSLMPMSLCDVQEIASSGKYGGYLTSRTLQDWVVSRQRSWGTPIPMILSADGKTAVPLSDNELPFLQGKSAGEKVPCERLKDGEGYYETDTLDTFFDSSWYFLRYLDPKNEQALISAEAARKMPVDTYVGGIEHAAVHMFFARFMSYFLADIGVIQEHEPFRNLIPQGIVRGKTFVDSQGRYFPKNEITVKGNKYFSLDGTELEMVFEKMSKSKRNGIDPLDVLNKDGIDITRLQLIDSAAPRQPINWEESDNKGLRKWIDRTAWVVSAYVSERKQLESNSNKAILNEKLEVELKESYNFFVRNVSMCLEVLNLHNTALARLHGFTNSLRKLDPSILGSSPEAERSIFALVTMMQVFAPYAASELWAALQLVHPIRMHSTPFLDEMSWPQVDSDCAIDFMLIVDGISCGRVAVPRKEIEHLPFEKVLERAKMQEHRHFFEKITEKGFASQSVTLTKRNGFHVTINVSLDRNVSPKEISQILNDLQRQWQVSSKQKKKAEAHM